MLILTIKTDQPIAEVGLYEDHTQLGYEKWAAHRQLAETIHSKILELLQKSGKGWPDLEGIVFFKGPGSFTGLRIGASVVNALADEPATAIIGTNGEDWLNQGVKLLAAGKNELTAVPEYGAAPHITKPVK